VRESAAGATAVGLPGRLVLASGNRDKLAALRAAVGDLVPVVPVAELPAAGNGPDGNDDLEGGPTVGAIAEAKALAWSRSLAGETVVATDGGLLIPALGAAWDPTRTRRSAGAGAGNAERARALLALTRHLRGEGRRIGWREALAVARDGSLLASWEVEAPPGFLVAEGEAPVPAGDDFWVPALWHCPEFGGRRWAELSAAEAAARDDHWRQLGRALRTHLLGGE